MRVVTIALIIPAAMDGGVCVNKGRRAHLMEGVKVLGPYELPIRDQQSAQRLYYRYVDKYLESERLKEQIVDLAEALMSAMDEINKHQSASATNF